MVFHSLEFLFLFLFLLMTIGLTKNQKLRKVLILAVSLFFLAYGDLKSLFIFFIISFVTFVCSKRIEKNAKTMMVPLSIFIILVSIFGSKFLISSEFYLPIGISFYGLQAISLLIDRKNKVFDGKISYFETLLYLSFFPQLIAGPICRVNELLPQMRRDVEFNRNQMIEGSNVLLEGLFLKLIVAGYLGPKVMHFINNPNIISGPVYWTLIILSYSCYIYADFNSYSKMSIGLAKILGFQIPINFKTPYLQKNLIEFWRNWHITLSSWLRDYIYIPLGGNKNRAIALFITFFLSSIWHGFGFNFIIWGNIHFVGLILTRPKKPIVNFIIMHFTILAGWIFFAAKDIDTSLFIIKQFFGKNTNINPASFLDLFIFSALTFGSDFLFKSDYYTNAQVKKMWNFAWPILMLVILLLKADTQGFIYYRF